MLSSGSQRRAAAEATAAHRGLASTAPHSVERLARKHERTTLMLSCGMVAEEEVRKMVVGVQVELLLQAAMAGRPWGFNPPREAPSGRTRRGQR
nr:unnamed protein product [Digitaria exilis]